MNYLISFTLCVAGTVFAALGHSTNTYWLGTCDINVAIFLFIAWALEGKR